MAQQTLAGQTLFLRLRLDSGFVSNVSTPGGFVLDVKSGTGFVYAQAAYTNIGAPNPWGWTTYTMNVFDARHVEPRLRPDVERTWP